MSGFKEKVERNRTATLSEVDGDLLLEGGTVIASGPALVVHGELIVRNRSAIKGNLKAEKVRGDGDLQVEGDMEVDDVGMENGASLEVSGNLRADDVDVPNSLKVGGTTEVNDLRVGGTVLLMGDAKVEDVKVGGTMKAQGRLQSGDVRVGGALEVNHLVCDDVKVGGSLKAEDVQADDVNVGGTVNIAGEAKINGMVVGGTVEVGRGAVGDVRVGGTMRSGGEITFEGIDVGGTLTMASGRGEKIAVGGLLDVGKDLALDDDLSVGGRAKIGGAVTADSISVGGELEAASAVAKDRLSVGGDLFTSKGSKAATVEIGRRARLRGPIIGGTVKLRENSEADDIYADSLWLDQGCSVKSVYARRAEIGRECAVSGHLMYTEDIRLGKGVNLNSRPEKVSDLPSPPL